MQRLHRSRTTHRGRCDAPGSLLSRLQHRNTTDRQSFSSVGWGMPDCLFPPTTVRSHRQVFASGSLRCMLAQTHQTMLCLRQDYRRRRCLRTQGRRWPELNPDFAISRHRPAPYRPHRAKRKFWARPLRAPTVCCRQLLRTEGRRSPLIRVDARRNLLDWQLSRTYKSSKVLCFAVAFGFRSSSLPTAKATAAATETSAAPSATTSAAAPTLRAG